MNTTYKNYFFLLSTVTVMQNELAILIVEDDVSFALELEMLIEKIGYRVHGSVDNSAEALEIMLTNPPDLVLMDIDIKGRLSGIEVAERLSHLEIPVLFITSFRDEATWQRAQQLGAVGYVEKPVQPYTLRTTISSVIQNLNQDHLPMDERSAVVGNTALYFKRRNIYEKITIDEIKYLRANDNYAQVFSTQGEYNTSVRLSEFAERLPEEQFMQIHRSYIVNLDYVDSIEASGAQLWIGEDRPPISRRIKKELFTRVNLM